MSKEDLTFKLNQKEYYAPDHTFTWFYHYLYFALCNLNFKYYIFDHQAYR